MFRQGDRLERSEQLLLCKSTMDDHAQGYEHVAEHRPKKGRAGRGAARALYHCVLQDCTSTLKMREL